MVSIFCSSLFLGGDRGKYGKAQVNNFPGLAAVAVQENTGTGICFLWVTPFPLFLGNFSGLESKVQSCPFIESERGIDHSVLPRGPVCCSQAHDGRGWARSELH